MALIVEDGTGLATANAYISVAEADAYFSIATNRWQAAESYKEKAIVRATRAIDRMAGDNFLGIKLVEDQALAWPRSEAYDRDSIELTGVPVALKRAVCEAALAELESENSLTPDTERTPTMERVEGAITVQYESGSYPGKTYRAVWGWLNMITRGSGLRVVRA